MGRLNVVVRDGDDLDSKISVAHYRPTGWVECLRGGLRQLDADELDTADLGWSERADGVILGPAAPVAATLIAPIPNLGRPSQRTITNLEADLLGKLDADSSRPSSSRR